jgi:putative DNA primase/helicase
MQRDFFEDCRGKWRGILATLGVDQKQLSGNHAPCPLCGGKDRFMFDDKGGNGSSICHQCGARTGFQLAQALRGWDGKTAVLEIRQIVGSVTPDRTKPQVTDEQKAAWNREVWQASRPIEHGDLADRYLRSRGVGLDAYPRCLRFNPDCRWGAAKSFPALISLIEGDGALIHRTYLDPDGGGKAPVDDPRRIMPGSFPRHGAVRLAEPGRVLGIAEGVETALSASRLFDVPVWATISAAGMSNFEPPEGVETVIIYGDHDANFTGHAVAYTLARRLVTVRKIKADVVIPDERGCDWNDVLLQERQAA